ncbi:TraR/DksA C4-type zinc finger protein [Longispora sp. NPDC051575]|uniref:TraR/DksA family transcriptional regulator n=1 Tax=Longispora sp. NPDC051575 TaxID=3154943 RepID=UPI00341F3F52
MTAMLTPVIPTVGVTLSTQLAVADADYATTRSLHDGNHAVAFAGDAADLAEAAASQQTGNIEIDRAARRVAELRAALDRLEAGTYGACERCARQIDAARLEVLPAARTCVSC